MTPVHVIGGGLAGSEAAWQITPAGLPVVVHEMRRGPGDEAHVTGQLRRAGVLNPLRSDDRRPTRSD